MLLSNDPRHDPKNQHPNVLDREYEFWTDQHGREWGAETSKRSDRPAGPMKPAEGKWQPPVIGGLAETRRMRFGQDRKNKRRFEIDYATIIGEVREIEAQYTTNRDRLGRTMYKSEYNPKDPPAELLEIVGPAPMPPTRYWIACREGDEWALGLKPAKDVPSWAKSWFVEPKADDAFLYEDEKVETKPKPAKVAA